MAAGLTCITSGFWPRVRARALRAPVFFRLINMQNGALRAPRPSQLRCFLFTPQSPNFPSGPNSGSQGCVYLSIGLSCTLLSYITSYWATLVHPKSYAAPSELSWILLSYAGPYLQQAKLRPLELRCTFWAKLSPSELWCTLLSYAAPYCATVCLTPYELHST